MLTIEFEGGKCDRNWKRKQRVRNRKEKQSKNSWNNKQTRNMAEIVNTSEGREIANVVENFFSNATQEETSVELKAFEMDCCEAMPISDEYPIVRRPAFLSGFSFDIHLKATVVCSPMDPQQERQIEMEYKLFEAARTGDVEEIETLLSAGVSIDAVVYNTSILHRHRDMRHIQRTPLQVAVACGQEKCVSFLVSHSADPNAQDHLGLTALHMAAARGYISCLKDLFSAHVECNIGTKVDFQDDVTGKKILRSTTALHLAAAGNYIECVKELIMYGANYNAVDCRGRTSLYIAAELGFSSCVLAHTENAVRQDILSLASYDTLDTPLHFAVEQQLKSCVQALVRIGSDVSHMNIRGYSPFLLAVKSVSNCKSSRDILHIILMEGYNLDINQRDYSGVPALKYVCCDDPSVGKQYRRRPKIAKLLLAYGADIHTEWDDSCCLLKHELDYYGKESELLKRIVKCVPQTLLHSNLTLKIPREFTMERNRRKIFTRALLIYLQSLPPPSENSHEMLNEVQLSSDDSAFAETLRVFCPFDSLCSKLEAESCIAYHLANRDGIHGPSDAPRRHDIKKLSKAVCKYRKHKWYRDTTKKVRSLKDYCRFAVRNSLSGSNLGRNVKKLDIPACLQSYLLFFEDLL